MSLAQLLSQPDLTLPQLFSHPDILTEIKQKMQLFIQFCKSNDQFTSIMITLGIKTPMHKNNDNLAMYRIANVANSVLTSDADVIADLFVIDGKKIRCYSEQSDEVIEEIVANEETGELVIAEKTREVSKFKYLIQLTSYLHEKFIDQNCLNYLSKVLNTIIRVKSSQFFQFLSAHPDTLSSMLELTCYPSISMTLIKLLNETEQQTHLEQKQDIVNKYIELMLTKVSDESFETRMEFVDEAFDKNRHRSEQFDAFKIVTQGLVDEALIVRMLNGATNGGSSTEIANSLLYLLKVVQRMNVDQQRDPYSYGQSKQPPAPTMNFPYKTILDSFGQLLSLTPKITKQSYVNGA